MAASQIAPFNWVGSLSTWDGTKGYWAKVSDPFTFSFNAPALMLDAEEYDTYSSSVVQSSEQAFYFVEDIMVEGLLDSEYMIESYCNGVLVGTRSWAGGWVDIPAMGNDGESYSYGYCNVGDIPEFILVGEMGNEIELSGTIPAWESNGIFMIGTLTESVEFPDQITLEPAYPNPFNPITTIEYGLSLIHI